MSEQRREVTGQNCRRCGKPLPVGAKLCTGCGTYVKSGVNAKTVERAKGVGKFGFAMVVGVIAALICGVVWAAIAAGLRAEIGYVAWGVGALTGLVVISCTQERGVKIAIAASLLAVLGIVTGKLLTAAWVVPSVDTAVRKLADNDDVVAELLARRLARKPDADPDVKAYVESGGVEVRSKEVVGKWLELKKGAYERLSRIGRPEREGIVRPLVEKELPKVSYSKHLKSQISPFDALWLILAVVTATKMGLGVNG